MCLDIRHAQSLSIRYNLFDEARNKSTCVGKTHLDKCQVISCNVSLVKTEQGKRHCNMCHSMQTPGIFPGHESMTTCLVCALQRKNQKAATVQFMYSQCYRKIIL